MQLFYLINAKVFNNNIVIIVLEIPSYLILCALLDPIKMVYVVAKEPSWLRPLSGNQDVVVIMDKSAEVLPISGSVSHLQWFPRAGLAKPS